MPVPVKRVGVKKSTLEINEKGVKNGCNGHFIILWKKILVWFVGARNYNNV